ncbi:SAM-dependent methyltransferase [Vacuolonema iberomarrocanum]|uniref:SAM-dependent methyltransferase n=1 Tax=Vacuolonema iberomarrocanum TaxID=3454632 RepID=UPI0019E8B598|nr:SAM-dependent methyltransferase [filamentous cyanobacterium LEGE 07170]
MGLQLKEIVPWGRSLAEYIQMFALSPADRQRRILDCGGGPASFNAEMTAQGHSIQSCDPLYQFSAEQITQRVTETRSLILEKVREYQQNYVWTVISDPETLGDMRLTAMRQFIDDFPQGLADGRYHVAQLPSLPYANQQFDLAVCGHLLFSYSDNLSLDLHQRSIQELCRVAREVRIFPVLTLNGDRSPWLAPIISERQKAGYSADLVTVAYEFQKGGNQMLRIVPIA